MPVYGTSSQQATLSPSSLNFGNVAVLNTSTGKNLTLTNNRSTTISISTIALGGTNPGDFLKSTTCGASLAAFSSCTITLNFKPTVLGARSAMLTVTDNASNSPQTVSLAGTGAVPVTVTPSSLNFGSLAVGSTSAAMAVSITNNQSTTLSISGIALGGANPGDFLKTTTCGASLAAFSSCSVSVKFKPLATATRNATLTVTDGPDTGSPHNVSLTGSGT